MNKKKIILISVVVIAFIITAALIGINTIEFSAFGDIEKQDVALVSYHIDYFENEEPVYLPLQEKELDEFYELIYNIRISGFGTNEHKNTNGGTHFMFRIQMNDGELIEFAAFNPGMIINGKYFDSEYEQTNALYEFWRRNAVAGRTEYGLKN